MALLLLLLISQGRTPGGHGLLEAGPRIYQVTPDIPGRRRATQQEQVRPQIWPTASKRVSSPPVGTIPSASDITDDPNHNSKPQRYDDPLAPGPTNHGFELWENRSPRPPLAGS